MSVKMPAHLPKWAVPVGIGAAALLLLRSSSRGSSGTRAAQNLAATDGGGAMGARGSTLQTADQLLQQEIRQAQTLATAQQSLRQNYANQEFSWGQQLVSNKQVGCPGGGTPRFDPSTLSWGCQQERKGTTGLDLINQAFSWAGQALGIANGLPSGGGAPRVGTPPINGYRPQDQL